MKSFTDELMEKMLGGRRELTDTEMKILRKAEKQWEVFVQSKGDSVEARLIQWDGVVAELDELAKIESKNPNHWFNFARLYAVASAKVEGKQAEYADRAVELLRKAAALGYKYPTRVTKEADLAPLRDRADYQQLLADLDKKFPQKLDPAPPPREKK